MMRVIYALAALCCVSTCTLLGGSITLGIDNGANIFPFGGPTSGPGTEYQEAYDSTDFSGPISITGIDFFGGSGTLYAGTYTLSLSTISANINTLSDTNFSSNLGADNTVFDVVALSGAAPSELTFTGGPFNYNPGLGSLLLDIQISGANGTATDASYEDGSGEGPAGVIRYQNFNDGSGTTGYGLVTEFDFGAVTSGVPEPGTFSLLGCGLLGLLVQRLRR
jgi:hypothetical protein